MIPSRRLGAADHSTCESRHLRPQSLRSIRGRSRARLGVVPIALAMTASIAACALLPSPQLSKPAAGPVLEDAIAKARQFRETFGLRSDDAWIRMVAQRHDIGLSEREYGVPLTADETAALDSRAQNASQVEPVVDAYGAQHPDDWAGLYTDQAHGGEVIAMFTANVAQHEAAIRMLINPKAAFEVRQATWTLGALQALQDKITADAPWFASIDAVWRGTGVDIPANRVRVSVWSSRADAAATIESHFKAAGKVEVVSDGVGPWLGGRGNVLILAVDAGGRPIPGLECRLVADVPSAYESGDSAWVTNTVGQCRIPNVGATGYDVQLLSQELGSTRVAGEVRIRVSPNETTSVRVVVSHQ